MKTDPINGVFTTFFGNTPRIRMLQYVLLWEEFEWQPSDLIRSAKTSKKNAYDYIKFLKRRDYITIEKRRGKTYYKLNKKKAPMKLMLKLYDSLLDEVW